MKKFFKAAHRFLIFFLLVAFVTTSCMTLFLSVFAREVGLELTGENLNVAAKLTFLNVVVLSLLFFVIDTLRRRYTVEKPVRQIVEGANRLMGGDFSVRIPHRFASDSELDQVIRCFNDMAQELGSVETLRSDFIANVSHEMKTPLAVLQNYARLLQDPHLPEEKRQEYTRGIVQTCKQTADMMTNILKLNKLENQQIFPKPESFDLTEQLCECLLQYENIWEEKNISIETELADGICIEADRELLSLVWNNLFSNAFKFTPEGGTVRLELAADENGATVRVTDTGCGIGSAVGVHIFEKFYQADSSHATAGNGLGLALVKRVVDILRGEISVESTIGQGSTFTVRIRRK